MVEQFELVQHRILVLLALRGGVVVRRRQVLRRRVVRRRDRRGRGRRGRVPASADRRPREV